MSKTDCPFTGIIEETARALQLDAEIEQAIEGLLLLRRRPPPVE